MEVRWEPARSMELWQIDVMGARLGDGTGLHKTMRKEFFSDNSFESIEDMQQALDSWVVDYNNEREHQALGDVPPIRRFELAPPTELEVIEGDVEPEDEPPPRKKSGDDASTSQTVGIRFIGDTVPISLDGTLLRTHRARHDKTKEFGAPAQPKGKPRRIRL